MHSILWFSTIFIIFLGYSLASVSAGPYTQNFDPRRTYELRMEKTREMISYLNISADPCMDFNQYSCGNYGKYFENFLSSGQWSPMYHTKHLMEQKIQKYLNVTEAMDTDLDRKVKQFYRSCLNRWTTPNAYGQKLKSLIQEFGKMPVLEGSNWRESEFDWSQVVADINAKTGVSIIMQAKMTPDSYDNTISRASLVQPRFLINKKIYYVDEKFAAFRSNWQKLVQTNLQKYLNVDENLALQTSKEIVNFEVALAHGMQDMDTVAPSLLYNWTSIDDLQSQYSHVWDTVRHFAKALDLYPFRVMAQPTYLNNLADVIQKTPKYQIANYIFYTYLFEYIGIITTPCESITRNNFKEYLENTMYHKYVTESDKAYIEFMWQELKSAFEDTFNSNNVNWMYAQTRQAALEKLHSMQLKIDSYEHIDFRRMYASLQLNDYDFVESYRAVLMLRGKEARERVNQPPKFQDPDADMIVYAPEENAVHFPVAYLQTNTIWSTSYPFAINFGGIGTFIGHELGHGFDDIARHFDKNGNYLNWWDSISSRNFEQRRSCIANQYKNYVFHGVQLPELEKQCENIADNLGAKHAFKAYMKWYSNETPFNRQNEMMPMLPYTSEQLFFVSFGQNMGGALSKDFVYDNDFHLPGELRLKGTLDNMPEFSRAFNCPLGSGMNPMLKCVIY